MTKEPSPCHIIIDDGLHRIIVIAKIDDGTKAARLMKHFRESDFRDNEFPEASKQIQYYKHTKEGNKAMSSVMEQIINDWVIERDKERDRERDAVTLVENVDKLAKRFNVTTAEACTFLDKTIADYEEAQEIIEKTEAVENAYEPA